MKPFARRLVWICVAAGAAALVWTGCRLMLQLPSLNDRSESQTLPDTADTRLGQAISRQAESHPGKSGVFLLREGRAAFAARALLADAAERTLDVQYYLWHDDMSGRLLFAALHRAAERGVRVRLLLDDNNTPGLDARLAALDAHPNMEVRLFNPFKVRRWRAIGYLTDFARLNRRMHNKSFTADNQATIVGGRNVGDEYFGASGAFSFVDLDVMAIGPVVNAVSRDFDRYWASGSSYPAGRLLPAGSAESIATFARADAAAARDPAARAYFAALTQLPLVREMLAGTLPFEWTEVRLLSDDPAKGLGRAAREETLPRRLGNILATPTHDLHLVSAYFVPTAAGVDYLVALAKSGVKITVLTNSLDATDVAAVHAGYAKWRQPLLQAGLSLYELKRTAAEPALKDRGLTGSSASSLHAKTFSADGAHLFIGSFNFDPRSVQLNTEMGFVIESPVLVQALTAAVAGSVRTLAYEVRLDDTGSLQWVEQGEDGQELIHQQEPHTTWTQRSAVWVLSRLPIEWLL